MFHFLSVRFREPPPIVHLSSALVHGGLEGIVHTCNVFMANDTLGLFEVFYGGLIVSAPRNRFVTDCGKVIEEAGETSRGCTQLMPLGNVVPSLPKII